MEILSIRRGSLADHSSTSYEFLAIDRPLDARAKAAVSRPSSRACPTSRRVSFLYHGDWSDLPGGWEPLMSRYYDAMYSESYDWWTLAVAFDTTDDALVERLSVYAFEGVDDLGVRVQPEAGRLHVTISCRIAAEMLFDDEWHEHYRDDESEGDDDEGEGDDDTDAGAGDTLLRLLERLRACLLGGDCAPLYAVWEVYGDDEDEESPPKPEEGTEGEDVADELSMLLARP